MSREERERWMGLQDLHPWAARYEATLQAVEAERDRLRAALERVRPRSVPLEQFVADALGDWDAADIRKFLAALGPGA